MAELKTHPRGIDKILGQILAQNPAMTTEQASQYTFSPGSFLVDNERPYQVNRLFPFPIGAKEKSKESQTKIRGHPNAVKANPTRKCRKRALGSTRSLVDRIRNPFSFSFDLRIAFITNGFLRGKETKRKAHTCFPPPG